jgi:uncharacterized Fe-S cluster-containing protein
MLNLRLCKTIIAENELCQNVSLDYSENCPYLATNNFKANLKRVRVYFTNFSQT